MCKNRKVKWLISHQWEEYKYKATWKVLCYQSQDLKISEIFCAIFAKTAKWQLTLLDFLLVANFKNIAIMFWIKTTLSLSPLLIIFESLWWGGKHSSISFKNSFPRFVSTSILYGGLNHVTLRFLFLFFFFGGWIWPLNFSLYWWPLLSSACWNLFI